MTRLLGFLLLGVLAGMRAMAAPALVSRQLRSRSAVVFSVLAAGEVLADKMSVTPARTDPMPLLGRAVSGAASAAWFANRTGQAALPAALLAGGAAVGAAYGVFHLRRALAKRLPDPLLGSLEDVAAAGLAHVQEQLWQQEPGAKRPGRDA